VKFSERIGEIGLANVAYITCNQITDLWGAAVDELPVFSLLQKKNKGSAGVWPELLYRYFRLAPGKTTVYPAYMDKIVKRLTLDKVNRIFLSYAKGLFPPSRAIRKYGECGNMPTSYGKYIGELIKSWLR
jgi:hypothetical protein